MNLEKVKEIDNIVNTEIQQIVNAQSMERAILTALGMQKLKEALTDEVMQPIMHLQNSPLGFMTDNKQGYTKEIVKDCIIAAVMMGVQPYNNQINIIAGRMYVTQNGFGYLLKNIEGLKYSIKNDLPRINKESTSAACVMHISYEYNGEKGEESIEFPINVNKYMGADGVVGKGIRKARKWLYEHITNMCVPEGDIQDVKAEIIQEPSIPIDAKMTQSGDLFSKEKENDNKKQS